MSEAVLYEMRGPAAWITLNRPEKLNAINKDVLDGLHAARRPRHGRRRGEGGGADRRGRAGVLGRLRPVRRGRPLRHPGAHEWHDVLGADIDATMRCGRSPKPTIAAVRGYCLAGGCELAMACDMIVAGEGARFGEPEIRYGSGPVTLLMPFMLGQKKTNELLFTGDMIDAEAALRAGHDQPGRRRRRDRGRGRGPGAEDRPDAAAGAAADEDRAPARVRGDGPARKLSA